MKNTFRFITIITVILFFASCSNLFNETSPSGNNENTNNTTSVSTTQNKYGSIQGHFDFEGAMPSSFIEDSSRTAVATLPAFYYVIATRTDNPQITIPGSVDNTNKTYSISGIEIGVEWKVEIGIKNSSDAVVSIGDNTNKIMNAVSEAFTLEESNPLFIHDFILKPLTGTEENPMPEGSVLLIMYVPSTITELSITGSITGLVTSSTPVQNNPTIITLSGNITPGSYKVTFEFKNSSHIPLYRDTQIINVLSNCTTDKWLSNGGTGPISGSSYTLTEDHLNAFARTTFYVGNTSYANASATGFGSFADPVMTLSRVESIIIGKNDSNATYTIYVSGTVTGAQTLSSNLNGKASAITICGLTPTTAGNEPANVLQCSTNGNTNKSTLTLETSVPVTIENLKISKGYKYGNGLAANGGGLFITAGTVILQNSVYITENIATSSGGGIYVKNATLKLGDYVVITKNQANGNSASGGGVFVDEGAKLFMYGSSLIGDMTETTASYDANDPTVYGNFARGNGGGISNNGGQVYIGYSGFDNEDNLITSAMATGYGIRRNVTIAYAGGIFQYSTNTGLIKIGSGSISYNASTDSASKGGAIYVEGGSTNIGAATMKKNSAVYGGAINTHTSTSITIDGETEIAENSATNGGAIYSSGTVTVTGAAVFKKNTASVSGGAVYIANPGTFDMQNGTIGSDSKDDNNKAGTGEGGAVYVVAGNNSHLKMKGAAQITFPSGSSAKENDVYLSSSKTIEITDTLTQTSVATITVPTLVRGTQVLSGGATITDGTGGSVGKFNINATNWVIEKYGSDASATGIINADIYVSASGSDSNTGASSSDAFKTIFAATKACRACKTEINVVGSFIASDSTELQSIPNSDDVVVTSITLKGTGDGAIINANSKGRALTISKAINVTIENITLQNGSTTDGAGIYASIPGKTLTLGTGVKITSNVASGNGGGVYIAGKSGSNAKLIMNSTAAIYSNSATTNGGGVYLTYTDLCMSGSAIIGDTTATTATSSAKSNSATNGGGVYSTEGNIWLGYTAANSNSKSDLGASYGICHNYASGLGGGIYNSGSVNVGGTVNLNTGSISFNQAEGSSNTSKGGAIYNTNCFRMSGGVLKGNLAYDGAAVYNYKPGNSAITMYFSGGTIGNYASSNGKPNSATNNGGAIYNDSGCLVYMSGTAVIGYIDSSITTAATQADLKCANIAKNGSGIYNKGSLYIGYTSSTNTDDTFSGGIYYNYTQTSGGGVYNSGSIRMHKGKISFNGSGTNGGGVYNATTTDNSFLMNGGSLETNSAGTSGGAIYIVDTTNAPFVLSGNAAIPSTGTKKNNDIYLNSSSSIKINDTNFEPGTTNKKIWITPSAYSSRKAIDGTDTILANAFKYFYVTKENTSDINPTWVVNKTGNIIGGVTVVTGSDAITPDKLTAGTDYTFVFPADMGNYALACAFQQLFGGAGNDDAPGISEIPAIGSGSVIDLSRLTITSFSTAKTFYSSDTKTQTISRVILPATLSAEAFENTAIHSCFRGVGGFEVDSSASNIKCYGGAVYNSDYTKLLCYPGGQQSFSLHSSCTEIGAYACCEYQNTSTEGITIPNAIKKIGKNAFNYSSIRKITFPTNANFTEIPENCCRVCVSLTMVIIPSNVTTISKEAFYRCVISSNITLPTNLQTIGEGAFKWAFSPSANLTLSIPSNVSRIGQNAFTENTSTNLIISLQNKNGWYYSDTEYGMGYSVDAALLTSDEFKSSGSTASKWLHRN